MWQLSRETARSRRFQSCSGVYALAADKAGTGGWVLVLLDADDDCPAEKGREVERRAAEVVPYRRISVVFANREYEAWFLAGAASLNGFRGFQVGEDGGVDAESVRNAKGWMTEHLRSGPYREILDQPAFSAKLDLEQTFHRSRSFRKLCSEWQRQRHWLVAGTP